MNPFKSVIDLNNNISQKNAQENIFIWAALITDDIDKRVTKMRWKLEEYSQQF